MSTRNKEIIEDVNKSFEENKPETFLDHCTDDIEWTIAGDTAKKGKDAVREFMASMGECEPPKIGVNKIISEGDSAACYGDMTMRENEVETTYSYCDIYRFDGEKIAYLQTFIVKHQSA
ncbi:MAG: nuclear transport factor 2 family protein [Chloracidobacterium sp.]|nr:nuclear transport factor 2 family protein [Chloracidobacterium sp.]